MEEGFLLYASLVTLEKYNLWQQVPAIPCDRNEMVELVTREFNVAFIKRWGDHICESPGCKSMLVLDGNMKNARQVCMVKDVAELHFSAINGSIVVGCQNTPAKGSRYCAEHCETAISFRDDSVESTGCEETEKGDQVGCLITKILNEKTTRQGIIYQVVWADGRQSWVKKCNLPSKIRESLEVGYKYHQQLEVICEFGQQRTELKESPIASISDGIVGVKTTGFAIENEKSQQGSLLSCGTEKGKHKCKNHRTAGILAIAKPCSVVVDIKELYGSESKSQVYAHLHELLSKDEMTAIDTIIYDDACHLKKYGCNPVRSQLTPTARRMHNMSMVVDKFHFKNHVDKWCKAHCNPYDHEELKDVNTEVCEQLFSWLSRFAPMSKHMNQWRFLFLILYLIDQHNEDATKNYRW